MPEMAFETLPVHRRHSLLNIFCPDFEGGRRVRWPLLRNGVPLDNGSAFRTMPFADFRPQPGTLDPLERKESERKKEGNRSFRVGDEAEFTHGPRGLATLLEGIYVAHIPGGSP